MEAKANGSLGGTELSLSFRVLQTKTTKTDFRKVLEATEGVATAGKELTRIANISVWNR